MQIAGPDPLVTVLIPVKDGSSHIGEALKSCVGQLKPGLCEVLVVDDHSADNTVELVNNFKDSGLSIRIIHNEKTGVGSALQFGLLSAKGKYVARLDADDKMFPNRLKLQLDFFAKNNDVVALGGQIEPFGSLNLPAVNLYPEDSWDLRRLMGIGNQFADPTVTFLRAEGILAGGFRGFLDGAEQYDFWLRISRFGKLANLPVPLTYYRIHGNQFTQRNQFRVLMKTLIVQMLWTFSIRNLRFTNRLSIYAVSRRWTLLGLSLGSWVVIKTFMRKLTCIHG
jgi:glycosyltransferase involved in cell wall biosynthesis